MSNYYNCLRETIMPSVRMKQYVRLTPGKVKTLLRELEKTGNLTAAAAKIDVTPQAIYKKMQTDKLLADAIEVARNKSARDIESELRRRGIEGVEEDVWHNGEVVGTKVRYSDRLLELLAKGNIPKYGKLEERFGVQVNIGGDSVKNKLASMLGVQVKPNDEDVIEGQYTHLD